MTKAKSIDELKTVLNALLRTGSKKNEIDDLLGSADCLYLLAPTSFLGNAFSTSVVENLLGLGKAIFFVDDSVLGPLYDFSQCPVISTEQFIKNCSVNALAVNMANTIFAQGFFLNAAVRANVKCVDIIDILNIFDLPVIYQTAKKMHDDTLSNIEDYLAFAEYLDDDWSIKTLGAVLKMRITMNREAVIPILCSLEDEYFSPYPSGKDVTFSMGGDEIYCDIGAHVGTTIRKFLTATQWRFSAIHAFEPDRKNYAVLEQAFSGVPNFHSKNIALSNSAGSLYFSETGTMGSRLDQGGGVITKVSTLDDELERVTFIKMDVEGHESRVLQGARRLISDCKPRIAVTGYHFANDLLDIAKLLIELEPRYRLRLRHHSFYYFDTILYADVSDD